MGYVRSFRKDIVTFTKYMEDQQTPAHFNYDIIYDRQLYVHFLQGHGVPIPDFNKFRGVLVNRLPIEADAETAERRFEGTGEFKVPHKTMLDLGYHGTDQPEPWTDARFCNAYLNYLKKLGMRVLSEDEYIKTYAHLSEVQDRQFWKNEVPLHSNIDLKEKEAEGQYYREWYLM